MLGLIRTIAERFGLLQIHDTVLRRRVPETPWYFGDGAALTLLLLIQVATGITMTVYYTNSSDYAYESVKYFTNQVTLGWLVRGIHYWSAGIMVIVVATHIIRHLLLGGYKAPREGTWSVGVILFFLVLAMSFTGYVLRWDEESIYAIGVVFNTFNHIPVIGDDLIVLLQGGIQLGSATLTRLFSLHIWIIPLLLISLVWYHLYLVILHGVTHRAEWEQDIKNAEHHRKVYKEAAHREETGQWFHPDTAFASGAIAFIVFLIVFVLAFVFGPPPLFPEANLTQISMPEEEWWFSWFSALIALLPPSTSRIVPIAAPFVVFVFMAALPILDRSSNRGIRRRPFWVAFVLSSVIALLWLSDLRRRSPWTGWPDPVPPPVPAGIALTETAEKGRQNFARFGCNSCHSVSSHGRQVGPDLARMKHQFSPSELSNYILKPPSDIAMPAYKERISNEDLDLVVEFVLVAQTFH